MNWQPYLRPTTAEGPFLLARLVSQQDPAGRAICLDAKLDTGSTRSCIPRVVIEECHRAGIFLAEGRSARAAGAFDKGHAPRKTYWFQLTICAAPAVRASLSDDFLRAHFRTSRALYPTPDVERSGHLRGVEMPVTEGAYALIGHDVLAHWTVILHGRSSHFKVMDRGGRWFIFSLAPK